MCKAFRITVATVTMGIAALSLTAPAYAGTSDVGAGLVGFGIGAIIRTHTASGVCRSTPTAGLLCTAAAAGLLRGCGLWTAISVRLSQIPSPLTRLAGLAVKGDSSLPIRPCSNGSAVSSRAPWACRPFSCRVRRRRTRCKGLRLRLACRSLDRQPQYWASKGSTSARDQ